MKKRKLRYFILRQYEDHNEPYSDLAIISSESMKKNPLMDRLAKPLFEAKIFQAISSNYKGYKKVLSFENIVLKACDPGFEELLGDPRLDDYLTMEITFQYIDDVDFGDEEIKEYWYLDPIDFF